MTVQELKEALDGFPDHYTVDVQINEDRHTIYYEIHEFNHSTFGRNLSIVINQQTNSHDHN